MTHDSTTHRARRGYIIMAVLFAAALLIFNMDVVRDWFHGFVDVVAVVPETSGVRIGSSVYVEGMEAGRVTGVGVANLGGRGAVALDVRLEDKARTVVRKGSQATTQRRQFVGEPMVLIFAGAPGSPPVETGDTLYPARQVTLDTLLERGKAFAPTLDSLTVALVELERLVGARRPDLAPLVERMAVASEEAGALRADLQEGSLGRWLRDPTLGARVRQLQDRMAELSEATEELKRYGDPELRQGVAAVGERSDRLMAALEDLERGLAAGDGALGRMQRDSAIAVAIAGVQAQIDSLRAEGLGFALRMFIP